MVHTHYRHILSHQQKFVGYSGTQPMYRVKDGIVNGLKVLINGVVVGIHNK
jgi:hypothetical protein